MELFNSTESRIFFSNIQNNLSNEISQMSDDNILSADFNDWISYYQSKYELNPIIFFEENIENDLKEEKLKRYNYWHKQIPYEPEYHIIDGYRLTFKIPFDGNENLFNIRPSTFIMSTFQIDQLVAPKHDNVGFIKMSLEFTKQELTSQSDMKSFVSKSFENDFKEIRQMISYINAEVKSFNNGLPNIVSRLLDTRKNKASTYNNIREALNIPLQLSTDAPNIKPIPLKRIPRMPAVKPAEKILEPEYTINDSDYKNITNIIHNVCSSMEKTARTFTKNDEEELRDFIIATLNTHYTQVSGETFRKIGKTDIHIEFENKAAFIGECKIWHGIKNYQRQ